MISKKEYEQALKIVKEYEEQVKKNSKESKKFKLKDVVMTTKGCRQKGGFAGIVVGFGTWKEYPAVKVRKNSDGRTVMCLAKNLVKC